MESFAQPSKKNDNDEIKQQSEKKLKPKKKRNPYKIKLRNIREIMHELTEDEQALLTQAESSKDLWGERELERSFSSKEMQDSDSYAKRYEDLSKKTLNRSPSSPSFGLKEGKKSNKSKEESSSVDTTKSEKKEESKKIAAKKEDSSDSLKNLFKKHFKNADGEPKKLKSNSPTNPEKARKMVFSRKSGADALKEFAALTKERYEIKGVTEKYERAIAFLKYLVLIDIKGCSNNLDFKIFIMEELRQLYLFCKAL